MSLILFLPINKMFSLFKKKKNQLNSPNIKRITYMLRFIIKLVFMSFKKYNDR